MDIKDTIGRVEGRKTNDGELAKGLRSKHFKNDIRDTDTDSLSPSLRRQAEFPNVLQCLGYPTFPPIFSPGYVDNPEDIITQYNYHALASQVCAEFSSPDNALSRLSSQHGGNAPKPVGHGKCSESSFMVSGDRKLQYQATAVKYALDSASQHFYKLSKSLDMNIKTTAQPTNSAPPSIKQQPSHNILPFRPRNIFPFRPRNILPFRPIPKPKPQILQRSFDETPCANLAEETANRCDESSNNPRAREVGDEVSVSSKHQYSRPLGGPSPHELATEQAAPNMLSAPLDSIGIRSWVLGAEFPGSNALFPVYLRLLYSLFHDEWQRISTRFRNEANGSTSGQSECRPSEGASGTSKDGTPGKRKRSLGDGGNGEVPNDESGDEDDSTQRIPDKSYSEYLNKGLACPFYKNDPIYFASDLFHDGKYFICATRRFPNIARLKEHMYRKHTLPHTCSRCGDTFKNKSALDNHLPVRNPEKITCEIRTLPPSKTKGLTPDMEGELKKRSKNGTAPTAEAIWIDIYKRLFPGDPMPASGPYLTDSHGFSRDIEERKEYIQYSEQELLGLVQEELNARGDVAPEHKDLLISVMRLCQEKLRGMFQVRKTSGARLDPEDRSPESMSQSNETLREMSSTSPQDPFRPDSKIPNCGLEGPSLPLSQFCGNPASSPDIPSTCYGSEYNSPSTVSNGDLNYSHSEPNPPINQRSWHSILVGDLPPDTLQRPPYREFMEPIYNQGHYHLEPAEWHTLSQTYSWMEEPTLH